MEIFVAGRSLGIEIEFLDSLDDYIVPTSAAFTLTDDTGAVLDSGDITNITSSTHVLSIDAAHNNISTPQGFRQITVVYVDDQGNTRDIEKAYILESVNSLQPGVNSFKSAGQMIVAATNLAGVKSITSGELSDVRLALRQAYKNISRLNVRIRKKDNVLVSSTAELTATDLAELSPARLQRLVDAQLLEANFLIGGNPMEQRRRDGVMSESIGEVSQFFRTSKPLTLPVCREAAQMLEGLIVTQSVGLGRS